MTDWYVGFQKYIWESSRFQELKKILPIDPTRVEKEFYSTKELHWRAIQTAYTQPAIAHLMTSAIREYLQNQMGISGSSLLGAKEVADTVGHLNTFGHAPWPSISEEQAAEIRSYFLSHKVLDKNEKRVSLDELNADSNLAEYPLEIILNCPHLMEMGLDPYLLASVEKYLGAIPTVTNIMAWWSLAGRSEAKDAQLFHFDIDDYRFCKFFVYLTDVDMDSGPHAYIEKTHRLERLIELRNKNLDRVADFDSFLVKLRKTDQEVDEFVGESPKYFTGKAGSRFLVDTKGIHKGVLPSKHNRLIFQITFGVSPWNQKPLGTISLDKLSIKNSEKMRDVYYRYIYRLFVGTDSVFRFSS